MWASENVWNTWDAASLQAQSQQPLLLTMNCLNGYFVSPSFDSLSESLVKADESQLRLPLFDDVQAPICDQCVDW